MKTLRFKTNINCGGCVATVTPFLNAEPAIESWNADTSDPKKILTVNTDLESEKVIVLLAKAGYKAELL